MPRNLVVALVLIALTFLVLLFNGGRMQVDLLLVEVTLLKPIALFLFVAVGVVVGILLK